MNNVCMTLPNRMSCTGCSACTAVCPKNAIKMEPAEDGFLFPLVQKDLCVNCSACLRVCPVINTEEVPQYRKCFAAQCKDSEMLLQSASGGVFPAIATKILDSKGVVYGCEMGSGDCKARHIKVTSVSDIYRMQGSKYVQSELGHSFRSVMADLAAGSNVLFSGTPCQCAGLRKCIPSGLQNKLLLVEMICHGVMSPLLFEKYKENLSAKAASRIVSVLFRDKRSSPGRSSFVVRFENHSKDICVRSYSDPYGRLFQSRIALRDSCYDCKFRNGRSGSDITIGDFWGIGEFHPQLADKGAISAIIVHTEKGLRKVEEAELSTWASDFHNIVKHNPSVLRNTPKDQKKSELFARTIQHTDFSRAVALVLDGPWYVRLTNRIWSKCKMVFSRCKRK